MRRAMVTAAATALMAALTSGCVPERDVGYVEIKTFPSSAVPVLYLDTTKLDPIRNGVAVLRQQVGTAKLQTESAGGSPAHLCDIVVRKNRLTSVTVSVLERPPRCQCTRSEGNTTTRSCVS
jgi:hypothetical protein